MLTPMLLSHLPLPTLSSHVFEQIELYTKNIHLKSNTVLIRSGEVCEYLFFVVKGGFVCRYINEEYDIAKTINFYLPTIHPFMACIDSFFFQTPTQCELRAISESEVLAIKKNDLDTILSSDQALNAFYQASVIKVLTEENELKLKIISYSSEQLYQYLMQTFPAIIQQVPSKYIAEFMGISAEWLSKLKRPK